MTSPLVDIKDGASAYVLGVSGANITPGNTVVIRLSSQAGVGPWSCTVITADELSSIASINGSLVIDSVAKTATFTAPAAGACLRFQSRVNNGLNANGVVDTSLTTTFCLYTLTINGGRVHALDETTEGNALAGWGADNNALLRGTFAAVSGGSLPKTLTAAQTYDLTPADMANISIEVVSNGANVIRLTPVTTAAGTYFRYVQNVSGGGTVAVKDTNNVAASATLASGAGAWFRVSVGAVKQLTAAFTVA